MVPSRGRPERPLPERQRRRIVVLAAVALLGISAAVAGQVARIATHRPDAHETRLWSVRALSPGRIEHVRVRVSDALAPGRAPIEGARVALELRRADARASSPVFSTTATTPASGTVSVPVTLPANTPEGRYELVVHSSSRRGASELAMPVPVERPVVLAVGTDKPLYQPGQTVHLRTLATDAVSGAPLARAPVELVIETPSGTRVLSESLSSSEHGIASTTFELADPAPLGRYTIATRHAGGVQRSGFEVARYRLPRFEVLLEPVRRRVLDGDPIDASIRARTLDGVAVADAEVRLSLREPIAPLEGAAGTEVGALLLEVAGRTDAAGAIELRLPPAHPLTVTASTGPRELVLLAEVRDPALGRVSARELVTLTPGPLEGVEEEVSPADDGRGFALELATTRVRAGELIRGRVRCAAESGWLLVDLVAAGRNVGGTEVPIGPKCASFELPVPDGVVGELAVLAYLPDGHGEALSDARVVEVAPAERLAVEVDPDRSTYAPGERARLAIAVTDGRGRPRPAALGLAVVDEAVHAALGDLGGVAADRAPAAPASERAVVTVGDAGYHTRDDRHRRDRYLAYRSLRTTMLWVAFAIYAALVAPIFLYGRLRIGHTLVPRSPGLDGAARRRLRSFALVWLVATYAAPFAIGFGAVVGRDVDRLDGPTFGAYVAVLALGAVLEVAARSASRWARLAERFLLADAVRPLPLAFVVLGWVAATLATDGMYGDGLFGLALVWPVAAVVYGSLAVAWLPAERPVDEGTWLWVGASRGCLVGGVLLGLLAVLVIPQLLGARERARGFGPGAQVATVVGTGEVERSESPGSVTTRDARIRRHFPESALVIPEIVTDAGGRAEVEVPLGDALTRWRVPVDAIDLAGRRGAVVASLVTTQALSVEPSLPAALTEGDRVRIPVEVRARGADGSPVRGTGPAAVEVRLDAEIGGPAAFGVVGPKTREVALDARGRAITYFTIVARESGEHDLALSAKRGEDADRVRRTLVVRPRGPAVHQTVAGESGGPASRIVVPADADPRTLDLAVTLYPSAFGELAEGLEAVFRKPHGCFEQTSSTTYPSVLALDYLARNDPALAPAVARRAHGHVREGYQRLLTFEVPGGGFEWFGRGPAHVALSAYGLMEFVDMSRVHPVDPDLIERTGEWLLSRRGDDGRWRGDGRHAGSGPRAREDRALTAYVTWALADAGVDPARLERSFRFLEKEIDRVDDPYELALVANALVAGRSEAARDALERLARRAETDGSRWSWPPGRASAVHGSLLHARGTSLEVETTALAAYALVRAELHPERVRGALGWLLARREPGGTWSTTQATVLALRALIAGSDPDAGLHSPALARVSVNGDVVAELPLDPARDEVYRTLDLDEHLRIGVNRVEVRLDPTPGADAAASRPGVVRYQVAATHHRADEGPPGARVAAGADLSLRVALERHQAELDQALGVSVELAREGARSVHMPIIVVPLAPGLEPDVDDLIALEADGRIARHERIPGELRFYLDRIDAGRRVELRFRVRPRFTGRFVLPPARAHAYYAPELEVATAASMLEVSS